MCGLYGYTLVFVLFKDQLFSILLLFLYIYIYIERVQAHN